MESKFKRIGIVGASGTGKTKLANHICTTYQLPYINSSSSQLWGKYGYMNHKEVVEGTFKDPESAFSLQSDILEIRNGLFYNRTSFITDRTPVDQLAYFLNYFPTMDFIKKLSFIRKLEKQSKFFDAFIFIPFTNDIIEDNGVRIIDPLYQVIIDATMNMIFERNLLNINKPLLILDKWDWDDRIRKTENFLLSI